MLSFKFLTLLLLPALPLISAQEQGISDASTNVDSSTPSVPQASSAASSAASAAASSAAASVVSSVLSASSASAATAGTNTASATGAASTGAASINDWSRRPIVPSFCYILPSGFDSLARFDVGARIFLTTNQVLRNGTHMSPSSFPFLRQCLGCVCIRT
ncbi:hypothetical protein K491DRAFT_682115 [Lophiostoma macrostomum CBS 122681]|uniref:Uncharacterized protein n=1 Tax=Lophiostoma macrostomum CBS 122681 TaxID=1314788 RepID=A0A6A6SUQ9_9PLEO|nr:hypothetical protein K491DRAFT_682115 [Lophiostoma macrostomum CBS 122681]